METGNKYFKALITDSDYDSQNDKSLRLSARLKADSFFYAIFDENNSMLVCDELSINSSIKFSDRSEFRLSFESITIAIDSGSSTMVDKKELTTDDYSLYFSHLVSDVHRGLYHKDELGFENIINLYPLDNTFLDLILEQFPKAKITHFGSCLMNYAERYKSTAVYVHIEKSTMYVTYVDGHKLILHNQYSVESSNDYLYHLSLIYQEFGIDNNIVRLILSGEIYPDSGSYDLLRDYFRNIEFAAMKEFSVAEEKRGVLLSQYFDNYVTLICG